MAGVQIVDVKEHYLECLLCDGAPGYADPGISKGNLFIVDNTRSGKETLITHLWETHQFKGFVAGVS